MIRIDPKTTAVVAIDMHRGFVKAVCPAASFRRCR